MKNPARIAIVAASLAASMAQAEIVTRVCLLTGLQEVPANASTARGAGRFVIDTDQNTMTYEIVYWGLSSAEQAAHIHGFSAPGFNSGVVHPLPSGTVKAGTWNFTDAQESAILGGLCYVNIHSVNFPGGEIRGQIVSAVADLDGGQEVPANATPGTGFGLFNINPVTNELSYYISFAGLTGPDIAAHFHGFATHGVNAGVVHNLPLGSPKVGVWNFTEAQEQGILDGLSYVNIHTNAFPGGEIRGQVVTWVSPINGVQEVPMNASISTGYSLISVNQGTNTLGYDIRHSGLASGEIAAHFHGFANPGSNAGVVQNLPLGMRKQGTWAFGAANLTNVLTSRSYINIHSNAFPGGEIRGQVFRGMSAPCEPLVTTQPSPVTVTAPTPVSLMVVAETRGGGALSYQWRRNGNPLPNAAPYAGVTTATLTIDPTDATLSGMYDVVITNLCRTIASDMAQVTIEGPTTCEPDFNQDGNVDQDDIACLAQVVAGDPSCSSIDPDFNQDGNVDQDDIATLEQVVGGQPCP
ncbi:MAG: CHRD domain-containing protein [Planctomycetota bacterium]|nr:CHRD domain-containing protein [Planctomycetota bacterium]